MLQPSLFPLTVPKLYPYQQDAVEAVLTSYLTHGKTKVAIELPTRAGKTFIINEIIRRLQSIAPRTRTLFLVPSISLAHQALRDAQRFFHRHEIGIVQADYNEVGRPIIIATVQTLADPIRRAQLLAAQRFERFSLVALDECHLSLASSYSSVLADMEHPYGLRLGCSATPYRGDGRSILPVFPDGLVYYIDIQELIRDGYLLPFEAHKLQTDLDFSDLVVDGIWEAETEEEIAQLPLSIQERMRQSNRYAVAFKAWQDVFSEDRILIFANDIKDVYGFHEYFSRLGAPSEVMTSKTTERERIFEAIHEGTLRVLIGYGVFTTGVTLPRVKGAIIGRIPWMKEGYRHLGIHQQSVGRVIGLSDERDADGKPIKTVGKIAYLTTKEYNTIPPIMSMGCLPGDLEKLGSKQSRDAFLKQVDEELGVVSTPTEREAYTPPEITLKLRKMEDHIVDLFIGEGWKAHPDGSFTRTTKEGTLSVQREGVACYSISLETDGRIIPIPFSSTPPCSSAIQEYQEHSEPVNACPLTTARQALTQASHYMVRMRLQSGFQQGTSGDKNHLITQDEHASLLRYLKQQRRLFLPHGLSFMTYGHYQHIQDLLKKYGDAFPEIHGKKCQLSFDRGRVFFRPLPEKTAKKKGGQHAQK